MNQIVKLLYDKVIALELNLADIPTRYKNDVISELSKVGFLNQSNLDDIKDAKISEMSASCNSVITRGFDVELSDKEKHHFSLTVQDQLNLITLSSLATAGETVIPYHADGEICREYSAEDISLIVNAATAFKTYHVTYFNSLKVYIKALSDISQISQIKYGVDIPEEYQSDILKTLLSQMKIGNT